MAVSSPPRRSHGASEMPPSLARTLAPALQSRSFAPSSAAIGILGVVECGALFSAASRGWIVPQAFAGMAVALAAGGLAYAHRNGSPLLRQGRLGTLAMVLASTMLMLWHLPLRGAGGATDASVITQSLAFATMAWATILWLPLNSAPGELPGVRLPGTLGMLACLASLVLIALSWQIVGNWRFAGDEALYVAQSNWLGQTGFGFHADKVLLDALPHRLRYVRGERLITQYTPGWPAMLAVARVVGLDRWLAALLGGVVAFVTALITRRLAEERGATREQATFAAAIAVALLVTNHLFLETHIGFLSHPGATVAVAGAAWMLLDGGPVRCAVAGMLIGVATTVRPLTGATLGASLVLWDVFRHRHEAFRRVMLVALGGVPFAVGLILYNMATTGAPLTFGYGAVHGSLHSLGFGMRGFVHLGGQPFGPVSAVTHFLSRSHSLALSMVGFSLMIPFLAFARATGARIAWRTIVIFALLPLGYFFYFYSHDRFYVSLLPFAFIGTSLLALDLASKVGRPAVLTALGAMLVGNVSAASAWADGDLNRANPMVYRAVDEVMRMADSRRILVVVQQDGAGAPSWSEQLFGRMGADTTSSMLALAGRNDRSTPLDSAHVAAAVARHPERMALTLTWCGADSAYALTSFQAAQSPASACANHLRTELPR